MGDGGRGREGVSGRAAAHGGARRLARDAHRPGVHNPLTSRRQRPREHLPSQRRLSNQAQHYVGTLAAQVVGPLALGALLQPLHQRKAVEEHKQ